MRIAALAVLAVTWAASAAAQPDPAMEIRRGAEAVSLSTSEAPASRAEAARRTPSPGFLLGAAYRAWVNAAAQLAFDLANPTSAGPAHASQTGALSDFIVEECREETVAYRNLEDRSHSLGLDIRRVVAAAGGAPDEAASWSARQAGPAAVCR